MKREVILNQIQKINRIEELKKHNWKKYVDNNQHHKNMQTKNNSIWTFYHELEPGLWAKFKENADGTWTYINSWDELKDKKKK